MHASMGLIGVRLGMDGWRRGPARASKLRFARAPLVLAMFISLMVITSSAAAQAATLDSSGLPNGRSFELVSPEQKNGNFAGDDISEPEQPFYSIAAADGESVLFGGSGPIGETQSGIDEYSVARRSTNGWSTSSALPRPEVTSLLRFTKDNVGWIYPSSDNTRFAFTILPPVKEDFPWSHEISARQRWLVLNRQCPYGSPRGRRVPRRGRSRRPRRNRSERGLRIAGRFHPSL